MNRVFGLRSFVGTVALATLLPLFTASVDAQDDKVRRGPNVGDVVPGRPFYGPPPGFNIPDWGPPAPGGRLGTWMQRMTTVTKQNLALAAEELTASYRHLPQARPPYLTMLKMYRLAGEIHAKSVRGDRIADIIREAEALETQLQQLERELAALAIVVRNPAWVQYSFGYGKLQQRNPLDLGFPIGDYVETETLRHMDEHIKTLNYALIEIKKVTHPLEQPVRPGRPIGPGFGPGSRPFGPDTRPVGPGTIKKNPTPR